MNLASLLARAQRTLDALHRRRRSHPPGVEAPPAGVCERPTGGRHTYRARDGGVGAGVSAAVIARARVGVWKVQEPRRCGSMWQGAASAGEVERVELDVHRGALPNAATPHARVEPRSFAIPTTHARRVRLPGAGQHGGAPRAQGSSGTVTARVALAPDRTPPRATAPTRRGP